MSHFSKPALESDPDSLERLREVLHGRSVKARTGRTVLKTPTLAERFGIRPDAQNKSDRQLRLVPANLALR